MEIATERIIFKNATVQTVCMNGQKMLSISDSSYDKDTVMKDSCEKYA